MSVFCTLPVVSVFCTLPLVSVFWTPPLVSVFCILSLVSVFCSMFLPYCLFNSRWQVFNFFVLRGPCNNYLENSSFQLERNERLVNIATANKFGVTVRQSRGRAWTPSHRFESRPGHPVGNPLWAAGQKSLVPAQRAQLPNQERTPFICTPWVPICLSFKKTVSKGHPLSLVSLVPLNSSIQALR